MQHDTDLASAEPPLVKWTRRYRGTLAQVVSLMQQGVVSLKADGTMVQVLKLDDYPFDRQKLGILVRPRYIQVCMYFILVSRMYIF